MLVRRVVIAALAAAALGSSGVRAADLQVVSTAPVRHTMAPAGPTIAITFDQPLLHSSITSSSFRVFGKATGPVTGSITFSPDDRTLTLTPSRPFSAGEIVLVNLSHDVRSQSMTPLRSAGYAYQFQIGAVPSTGNFQQIDVMSNRSGSQTRIYGAVQADLDRDGWIDLATVNEVSGDLRVFINRADGSGLYEPFLKPPFPIGLEASPNEPADFDNDGKIDIVVGAATGGGVWISHGAGDGTFDGSQTVLTGNEPHGVAVLDVDGDGDPDIVNAGFGDNRLALMLNDGTGTFGAPTFFDSGCDGEWALGTADMNNDGIYDLVAGCYTSGEGAVLLGNGNGTFTAKPPQNAGGGPWQVALGDVDGDGNIDAAFGNSFSANGGLTRGNGDGTLALPVTVPMPAHTPASDLADLDGDGDLDWILSSYSGGLWRIYRNDGAGHFSFDQDIVAPSNPSCAVPLDFDNDGDIDLALSDEIADVVVLMQNTSAPSPICPASPAVCRTPVESGRASLTIKDRTPDKGDQIVWKWVRGPVTPKGDYGTPLTTAEFVLCVYDGGELRTSGSGPPGGTCGGKPCWTDKPTSLVYRNRDGSPTGTQALTLKQGLVDGQASITFKAKGMKIVMPDLGMITGPVTIQLQRSGGAPCFGATYSALFQKSDATQLKDKAD